MYTLVFKVYSKVIHLHVFFRFCVIRGYYKILNIVSCAVQEVHVALLKHFLSSMLLVLEKKTLWNDPNMPLTGPPKS